MGYGNFTSCITGMSFNRFTNLDNCTWHIIDYLLKDQEKYTIYLWKLLKYNTADCLNKEDLTLEEKRNLIYVGNGKADDYGVFMSKYADDAYTEQSSHLHIYIDRVIPVDHIKSVVVFGFKIIVHNKIINIEGDASEYNEYTNPSELHNGIITTPYKNRAEVILKCLLAALNGKNLTGVGVLQFNKQQTGFDRAENDLFDDKKFTGFKVGMSSILSDVSTDPIEGY